MESIKQELSGRTADEIRELIETSVHAESARDPEMLAAYLAAAEDAPSSGGG